ncbi:cbb3-type cytochrome c oxidase subunit I [Cobetia crustatorum]|uniref:Uncharacterized protein n=1 Tax=Cobetia crustatorum TaxID=553385 RepID=A0A558HUR9_9GAMM|nr:cbb3-type cytochrome c oxidase subunit I [Cobetia crustatorum]TVU72855.1 hypothetical protein FQP86_04145 [Cobetia crustatorum]
MSTAPDASLSHHKVIRQLALMAMLWGGLSLCLAAWLCAVRLWPTLDLQLAWLSYGRLAPLQTHALLYGLGGSALIASIFHVAQHTAQHPLCSPQLVRFALLGWQGVIVLGSLALMAGFSSGHLMAEYPWPVDVLMTLVWLAVSWIFFTTLEQRSIRRLPVACWFIIGCLVMVLLKHVLASLTHPISLVLAIPLYTGSLDALLQRWQAGPLPGGMFALGFIGMLYHALPRQTQRPLYSHRLAIVSFWSLVLLLTWGGAPLLFASPLPQWSQTLGMAMGIVLLAPGLALSINGLLTLNGDWQSMRRDPLRCFMAAALVFYGLAVLEQTLLSIAPLNALTFSAAGSLSPANALGAMAMISVAMLYFLLPYPRLPHRFSTRLIALHASLAIVGTLLCVGASWATTLQQAEMWHALAADGSPQYALDEILATARTPMLVTLAGLSCWVMGMLLMAANVAQALANSSTVRELSRGGHPA